MIRRIVWATAICCGAMACSSFKDDHAPQTAASCPSTEGCYDVSVTIASDAPAACGGYAKRETMHFVEFSEASPPVGTSGCTSRYGSCELAASCPRYELDLRFTSSGVSGTQVVHVPASGSRAAVDCAVAWTGLRLAECPLPSAPLDAGSDATAPKVSGCDVSSECASGCCAVTAGSAEPRCVAPGSAPNACRCGRAASDCAKVKACTGADGGGGYPSVCEQQVPGATQKFCDEFCG